MKNKVILIILDGLGYSYARRLMGNLEGLGRFWRSQGVARPIGATLCVWPLLCQHPYWTNSTRAWRH